MEFCISPASWIPFKSCGRIFIFLSHLIFYSSCGDQGSELMSKYGINVPKGVAVSSVDEAKNAVRTAFPDAKEVFMGRHGSLLHLTMQRSFLWMS